MGSRIAKLVARSEGLAAPDGLVEFECDGRRYRLAVGAELASRTEKRRPRKVASVEGEVGEDARVAFADGGRRSRLSSVVVDYDLSQHQLEGEAPLPMPRPERTERVEGLPPESTVVAEEPATGVELATLAFDGDQLEVIELDGEGWVSFPSLLRPFGKRADGYMGILDGWARTRTERLAHTSRTGVRNSSSETTLLHFEHAPMAIARLDRRGMEEDIKAKHTRYLKECARVLADYFLRGRAENPRAIAGGDMPPWARELLQAVGGASVAANNTAGAARVAAEEAKVEAGAARATANDALAIAEEARDAARAASTTPTKGMTPGAARRVPEGVVVASPSVGFESMRSVARRFQLPSIGEGRLFVSRVADLLGVDAIEGATELAAVVAGGHEVAPQRRFGPLALDRMRPGLLAAGETMRLCGYEAGTGVLRPVGVPKRGRTWVLKQMLDAAAGAAVPSKVRPAAPSGVQQSIPQVENDAQSKAS